VDRAGADHDQQSIVFSVEYPVDLVPGLVHGVRCRLRDWQLIMEERRWGDLVDSLDAEVVGLLLHGYSVLSCQCVAAPG
jgi:hypothetical protein